MGRSLELRIRRLCSLAVSRPAGIGGVGVRHTLFPRTLAFGAQAHPLGCVPGCQFPDAALVCSDECRPFRLRSGAGPCSVSRSRACWARLLSSAGPPSADGWPPNPAWARMRIGRAPTCFRRNGTPPMRDRWPCATGLASYPSSCVFLLKRAILFSAPPALGSCCDRAIASLRGDCGAPLNPWWKRPIAYSGKRSRNLPAARFLVRTARIGSITLAHSSNFRLGTGLCSPTPTETRTGGRNWARGWFLRPAPLS
jgi:hypothetical protein